MTLGMKYDEFKREGLEEGKAEGRAEGMKQGVQQKAIETAREMKADKFSIESIMKYTKLSKEEILAL